MNKNKSQSHIKEQIFTIMFGTNTTYRTIEHYAFLALLSRIPSEQYIRHEHGL